MKTLVLMRHAKSSWDDAERSDFDRPLNARGKRDAPRMGRWLYRQDIAPQLIVSSSAHRARATASAVAEAMGFGGTVHFDEALYHAAPGRIIEVIHMLPDTFAQVMVVGHNPGLEQLLGGLVGRVERLTTAAVAVIELSIERWSDLQIVTPGRLVHLWRPKELPD